MIWEPDNIKIDKKRTKYSQDLIEIYKLYFYILHQFQLRKKEIIKCKDIYKKIRFFREASNQNKIVNPIFLEYLDISNILEIIKTYKNC